MKRFLLLIMAACLLAMASPSAAAPAAKPATSAPAPAATPTVAPVAPTVPTDAKGAAEKVGEGIKAARGGQWWYLSSVACLLLMFVLKLTGLLEKLGRWKYVILPVLSLAAGLLAAFQGGVTLETAIGVATSTWAMGMLEELWNHGILGKPKASAVAATKPLA